MTAQLKPYAVEQYERAHRAVPSAVLEAISAAGVHDWTIWRDGTTLYQLIVADSRSSIDLALTNQPERWTREMATLVEPGSGRVNELELCWILRNSAVD